MAAAEYGSLPFAEQIEFFRQKVPLGTRAWTDIWEGEHARAFVVAGAMKDELLIDFKTSIDKAISEGTTLENFRKDFDSIVTRHGWSYNGGRNWRTRVIYETNLRTSYQAARFKQMDEIKALRPFWEYRHSDLVQDPRPEHLAWDKLVLSADDPFWKTHYPPNGWGCQCTVFALSKRDLDAMGKAEPDQAPTLEYEAKTVGVRGPNPRTVQVPKGIDPGWGYNPGEAAFGRRLSEEAMAQWRATGPAQWERLTPGGWLESGRPERLPAEVASRELVGRAASVAAVAANLRGLLGGEERTFRPGGVAVKVDALTLAQHVPLDRSAFLPAMIEVLENPQEVWVSFERHSASGQVVLRSRIIRVLRHDKDRAILFVANARAGQLEGYTFFATRDLKYINGQRSGLLRFWRQ
ncbi:MAG: PBECR2 nuclease fold domain-containing protein [Panacagrimonas sp.]